MDASTLEFLTSDAGQMLLNQLATADLSEANTLSLLTQLRKTHDAQQAGAALAQAKLRRKAVDKFGDAAALMLFTDDALQQASDPLIRAYRAGITIGEWVLDAGCGIGADSLAFAAGGMSVLGVDIDPQRIAIAQHNAAALGLDNAQFVVRDIREGLPSGYDVVFFDPARRDAHGKRIYDVERYIPPLSLITTWDTDRIAVKLSPGVDVAQLASYDGGVEFISVGGDLKEAVLWRGFDMPAMQATLINGAEIHHWWREGDAPIVATDEPRGWLVEPDPALIRAGLVQDVAAHLNGTLLDDTIAYITTDNAVEFVWVRGWRILDWMPFHLKRLRAYLRERNVGTVTVKKRGSAITPEALISGLKLKGTQSRTLVLTRCNGQPIVLICEGFNPERKCAV